MTHQLLQGIRELWGSFWLTGSVMGGTFICGLAVREAHDYNVCRKCKRDMGIYEDKGA